LRFFFRFHGVSSGSAECGAMPVPPPRAARSPFRSTREHNGKDGKDASKSMNYAKPASGCAGTGTSPGTTAPPHTKNTKPPMNLRMQLAKRSRNLNQ
jgi:hypothetical protein